MAKKISKLSVNYRQKTTKSKRCGNCSMYRLSGTCTLVAGSIDPNCVCDRWAAK